MVVSNTDPAIKQLKAAISAIDLDTENFEIVRLANVRKTLMGKAEEARQEASRLSREIHEFAGPDPSRVADALLDGVEPMEAASNGPSVDMLRARKEAMAASAKELQRRAESIGREIVEVRDRALAKIAQASQPFAAALVASSQDAANQIIANAAAMRCLNDICRGYTAQDTALRAAFNGISGVDKLVADAREIEVPSGLLDALAPLEELSEALQIRLRSRVSIG